MSSSSSTTPPVKTPGSAPVSTTTSAPLATAVVKPTVKIPKDLLETMMQDVDGDLVFSNSKALFGFIDARHYLAIPGDVSKNASVFPTKPHSVARFKKPYLDAEIIGSKDGIKEYLGNSNLAKAYKEATTYLQYNDEVVGLKVALMNFHAFRKASYGDLDAFVGATLRARWVVQGAYSVLADDGTRTSSEVFKVAENAGPSATTLDKLEDATTVEELLAVEEDLSKAFVAQAQSSTVGMSWATRYAEVIWCASEHVVRVRGHHYKDEYKSLLNKYLTASYEGSFEWPAGVSHEMVFRTAIHPFGLRALPIMAAHFAIHGKLGNAGLVRLSGAPNGMAVVTTTAACLVAMSSEPWYGAFTLAYDKQLKILGKVEEIVLGDKYGYHLAHALYGRDAPKSVMIDGVSYTAEKMKLVGSVLATAAQGFVEAMRAAKDAGIITDFSFANAMAMKKAAANNPLGTIRIKELITAALESVTKAETIEAATKAALPAPMATAPAGP